MMLFGRGKHSIKLGASSSSVPPLSHAGFCLQKYEHTEAHTKRLIFLQKHILKDITFSGFHIFLPNKFMRTSPAHEVFLQGKGEKGCFQR